MEAGEQGADYISFGAFFETQTKISRGKPSVEILNWASEILNLPIVAIGGINDKNCGELIKNGGRFFGGNFLCVATSAGRRNRHKKSSSTIIKFFIFQKKFSIFLIKLLIVNSFLTYL